MEVHLIDYSGGPLYDRVIAIDLYEHVRGTIEFDDRAALQAQLESDVASVREIVGGKENPE